MPTCGTVQVVAPFDEANVSIESCASPPNEVTRGQELTLGVTVRNDNDDAAEVTAEVQFGGITAGRTTGTVPANGQRTIDVPATVPRSADGSVTITSVVGAVSQA